MSYPVVPPRGTFGRFALFIDGSNFYHTIRDLGLHIDYKRLYSYFAGYGTLRRAFYYTALFEGGQSPEWLIRLTDWLAYNGYDVVTKQARAVRRRAPDEADGGRWLTDVKGSIHVELTVDMLTHAPLLDTALLFSGDGSYQSLVRAVQRAGCRVIVVSSEKTGESTVATELRRQADGFIEIATIAPHIVMAERKPATEEG